MPFDVEGARKAGYTDTEIADHLSQDSGFDTAGARKAGYTDAELITHLRPAASTFNAAPTDRQQLLSSAPMRLAKGMKDPIDGAAQLAQEVFKRDLVSRVSNYFGGPSVSDVVNKAADKIGGPGSFLGDVLGVKGANSEQMHNDIAGSNAEYEAARQATAPKTLTDVITGQKPKPGADLMRLAGNILSPANVIPAKVAPVAAIGAPLTRLAGAGAAGGAAGAAIQPVMDEDFTSGKAGQVAAGAAGGAVLGPVMAKAGESAAKLVNTWRNSTRAVNVTPERLQELVSGQLQRDGIDVSTIPPNVFQGLADDVRSALASGRELNPAAALRNRDFQALGVTPLQGQLTRDPAQWQREFNLAGIEGVGEPLQQVLGSQSRAIGARFQNGAAGVQEKFDAGGALMRQLQQADEVAQQNVRGAYQAFRDSTGRELNVPLQGLAQDYPQIVRDYGDAIPAAVRSQFEALGIAGGRQLQQLDIAGAERLLRVMNNHYNPQNPAAQRGMGELRQALQRAVVDAADTSTVGAESAALGNEARQMAASRFQQHDNTPALRAAVQGMEPDKFVQRFVLGGNVNEIERMQALLPPEGQQQVRAQAWDYLRSKAFGANVAGDGKAAQASFNNELRRIGRPKLVALLGEDGAQEAERIGRVLAYIKQVPEGATPNVSGTGQMLASLANRGMKGLPYVNDFVVQPMQRFGQRREVNQALSGLPTTQQPAQMDPELVKALSALFAPASVGAGAALGNAGR